MNDREVFCLRIESASLSTVPRKYGTFHLRDRNKERFRVDCSDASELATFFEAWNGKKPVYVDARKVPCYGGVNMLCDIYDVRLDGVSDDIEVY